MTTFNDYLNAGLRAFEQWRPRLEERLTRKGPPPHGIGASQGDLEGQPSNGAEAILNPSSRVHAEPINLPMSVDQVLSKSGKLPLNSLVLGICDDGLPFLLDLTNPAPGALLVCGDAGTGKTKLVNSILDSASRLNTPAQLELSIIAVNIDEYMHLSHFEHCQEIFNADEAVTGELIGELVDIAEQRRRQHPENPAILLVIDDLAECLEHLDQEAFSKLYWLIRHGPRSRVWTIATLPAERARQIEPRFLSAFRTRLCGRMADSRLAATLSGDANFQTRRLEEGQFYIPYGGEWLRLWACVAEEDRQMEDGGAE